MRSSVLFSAALAGTVSADIFTLYAGYFAGTTLHRLAFDNTTNTLSIAENVTIPYGEGQKWISLDSRRQNLYVATTNGFQSFRIGADAGLTYSGNVSLTSECSNANHIAVMSGAPYTVFAITYSSCPTLAISVDESGALQDNWANATYSNANSNIHGGSVSAEGGFFYSADDPGNSVYVHSVDATTGTVEEIQHLDAVEGADPRHLTADPRGHFVYAVHEAGNAVGVYSRDNGTGLLTDTNTTYSLLPEGFTNSSSYWAAEVVLSSTTSAAPKYLLAATRSRTATLPGYVAAFALGGATGAVERRLFLLPTAGSGGSSNAVGATAIAEEYFTVPDSANNWVEMWRVADDGTGAAVVAHLDLDGSPANVVM